MKIKSNISEKNNDAINKGKRNDFARFLFKCPADGALEDFFLKKTPYKIRTWLYLMVNHSLFIQKTRYLL